MSGILYHSPAYIVRQLLFDLGLATDPDNNPGQSWPAYVNYAPPTYPTICLYDTPGQLVDCTQPDRTTQEYFGLQIRIGGLEAQDADIRARLVTSTLDQVANAQVNILHTTELAGADYRVSCLFPSSPLMRTGRDTGNQAPRPSFVFLNYLANIDVIEYMIGTGTSAGTSSNP